MALRPAPSLGEGEDVRGIEGVATHDDELIFVLQLRTFRDLTAHLALPPSIAPPAALPRESTRSAAPAKAGPR